MDLGNNQLQGFIPSSIGNLSSDLYFFSLHTNPTSGSIPADIGKLIGLTRIQLSDMQLRGTIPQEIGILWRLEMIDLANNTRRNSTDFWQPYQDEPRPASPAPKVPPSRFYIILIIIILVRSSVSSSKIMNL